MTTAYPLQWPEGWTRTPAHQQQGIYRFGSTDRSNGYQRKLPTFASARDRLIAELERLGARHVVISSNFQLNQSGLPSGNRATPHDQGIAVYFEMNGRPMVMANDRYEKAAGNLTSLALGIEAMRQLDRHGGGQMMERAFSGFAALPPSGPDCWTVLGLKPGASADHIKAAHRRKVAEAHPDTGGSHAAMSELNAARDEALEQAGAR